MRKTNVQLLDEQKLSLMEMLTHNDVTDLLKEKGIDVNHFDGILNFLDFVSDEFYVNDQKVLTTQLYEGEKTEELETIHTYTDYPDYEFYQVVWVTEEMQAQTYEFNSFIEAEKFVKLKKLSMPDYDYRIDVINPDLAHNVWEDTLKTVLEHGWWHEQYYPEVKALLTAYIEDKRNFDDLIEVTYSTGETEYLSEKELKEKLE